MRQFFLRRIKQLSIEVILLAILFIGCLWVLYFITAMVFDSKDTAFDERVFSLVAPHINNSNTRLMQAITFFGSSTFLLPANIILAGVFLFSKAHRLFSLKIVSISLTSTIVLFLLKNVIQRQRPLVPLLSRVHGYSYPSGHSFSSLVFFGMLAYIIFINIKSKPLKWSLIVCCFLFVILIGFSRIYLKLHFASDVIAGFCLGIIWLLLAKWLLIKTDKLISPEV